LHSFIPLNPEEEEEERKKKKEARADT